MSKEIFAGRSVLKRSFKEFFVQSMDEGKDSRSFLSFRKQRDQKVPSPWIFFFHGDEGLGKSTAINLCLSVAEDSAAELKRSVKTVSIDWAEWNFFKGTLPQNRTELMDLLCEHFCSSNLGISGHFAAYRDLQKKLQKLRVTARDVIKNKELQEFLQAAQGGNKIPDFSSNARDLYPFLSKPDSELYYNAEQRLTSALIEGLVAASLEEPLIISVDSYNLLSADLDTWFRRDLLSKLFDQKNRVIVLLAGTTALLRNYRNDFPEECLYAVNFSDILLTRHSIATIATKRRISLKDTEIESIEEATAGIPLAINDLFIYAHHGIEIGDLLSDTAFSDRYSVALLSRSVLDRFLVRYDDVTIRERVFSLAMFSKFDAKALAEVWNIAYADVNNSINDLSKYVSFLKNKSLHALLRKELRLFLLAEAKQGTQSQLEPFFRNFSTICAITFKEQLAQLSTAIQAAEKRCNDSRYTTAIEQLITSMMWFSPEDAFAELPGYFVELLHFNRPFARYLLNLLAEFRTQFSPETEKLYTRFLAGLHLVDIKLFFTQTPFESEEQNLLEYLSSTIDQTNDFHRALTYHVLGENDLRKGNLTDAMEKFDHSFSLLGNAAPEKSFLNEEYILLGYAFNGAQDYRNAIAAFSNAVLIRADNFLPWYNMGLARIALNEYEGSINALSEAVKLDPHHADAWFCLGLSFAQDKMFDDAIDSFVKATEVAPERSEIWFELGKTHAILEHHSDAVKAFRKVVLSQPDNVEAYYLMGCSSSVQGSAEDAIDAFSKAIEHQPDNFAALTAKGSELFKLKNFGEAADTFELATAINQDDAALWSSIAEARYCAEEYDLAIAASNTATSLDPDLFSAWNIMGNAYNAQENLTDAIDAYKKAVVIEPDNADTWQKLGTIYNTLNNQSEAIEAFRKAVDFDPSLKEVWYTIGLAYEKQNLAAEAASAYEKGTKNSPENEECWFHKGSMHLILEEYDTAFDSFNHVVDLNMQSHDAWFFRGISSLKTGNSEEAVTSFSKAVELDKIDTESWFNMGQAFSEMTNHSEAIRCFTEAASCDGQRIDIWHQLGLSNQALSQFEDAIAAYKNALSISPDDSAIIFDLGLSHYALSHYDEARDAFREVIAVNDHHTDAIYNLALTCHAQGNYNEAVEHYSTVTSLDSNHAEAWYNLALCYHAIEIYDKAIETYLVCVGKWPDVGATWFNLGLAYHASQEYDKAIKSYKEATQLTPDQPAIWYHLGTSFHAKEQYGDAIQAYRKVLQLTPDHLDAWLNLGMAYYVWQNYDDAIEAYSNVTKRDATHFTAWINTSIAYFASRSYSKAFDAGMKAYELKPDSSWIIGNVLLAAHCKGDTQRVEELTEELLSLDATGEEISRTIYQLKNILRKHPGIENTDIVIDKLVNSGKTANAVS